jgi:HlyD family secretion protein
VIRSTIDGTVVARNVDIEQTVAASLQAPTIFAIARDLFKMWFTDLRLKSLPALED